MLKAQRDTVLCLASLAVSTLFHGLGHSRYEAFTAVAHNPNAKDVRLTLTAGSTGSFATEPGPFRDRGLPESLSSLLYVHSVCSTIRSAELQDADSWS